MTDQLGARALLTLGGAFVVLATLSLAFVQSLMGFYLAFGLARVADQGFVQTASPAAIAKWFERYRGKAMAALFLASSLGGVILPLLVKWVIDTWHWQVAWCVLSGIMLTVGTLPCVLWVRRQPEDFNWMVDGQTEEPPDESPLPRLSADRQGAMGDAKASWRLVEARRTATLWLLLGSGFALGMVNTGVALHMVPYLVQQGMTSTGAVGAVSIGFFASGVGNLLWGYGADRLSVRRLVILAYGLRTASLIVLLLTDSMIEAIALMTLLGFADGGLGMLIAVLVADYYGRQHFGAIYGLLRAVQVAGFALGPLASGVVFDLTQSYDGAFQAFLVLSLMGTLLMIFACPPVRPEGETG